MDAIDADQTRAAEATLAQRTEENTSGSADKPTGAVASIERAHSAEATAYLLEGLNLRPLTSSRADALRAVRLLERAASLDPTATAPLYWCGVIHNKFGLHTKATDYFRQALKRDPLDPNSLIELGWIWLRTGEFQRARDIAATTPAPVNLAEVSADADSDDELLSWRWRRFKAAVYLEDKMPLAALDAYAMPPPAKAPPDMWWREFLHIARIAGAEAPAEALDRLEALYEQLPTTWPGTGPEHAGEDPGGRPHDSARQQYDDGFQQLVALMGNLAAAGADFERAQHYWDSVRPTAAAHHAVRRGLRAILDNKAAAAYDEGDLDTAISLWRDAVAAERGTSSVTRERESAPGNTRRSDVNQDGSVVRLTHALTVQGSRKWDAGEHDAAIELWEEVRRLAPDFIPAAYNLALALEHMQRWQEANDYWEAYIRLTGTDGPAKKDGTAPVGKSDVHGLLLRMAANAVRAGDRERARQLLQRADKAVPSRATSAAKSNSESDARSDEASSADGVTAGIDGPITDAVSAAKTMTYVGLLHTSVGNGRRALASFERALSLKPDLEEALQGVMHATALDNMEPLQALALIRSVSEQFPDGSRVIHYWRMQMLGLVKAAWERGNFEEAMRLCTELLLANAEDIDAWLWAGALHQKSGNGNGAQDCFSEAIRIDPDRPQTYIDLGAHMLAAGDRAAAETHFAQAVSGSPAPHIHVNIAELCAQIGEPDLAERHFRIALESVKEDAEPFLARAVCGLIQTGYEERVHTFLEQAYKQVPNNVYIRVLIALQHMKAEQWPDADSALRAAQQLATGPEETPLQDHIAFFRRMLILARTIGQIDEAALQDRVHTMLTRWLNLALAHGADTDEEPPLDSFDELLARVAPEEELQPLTPEPPAVAHRKLPVAAPVQFDLSLFLDAAPVMP